MIGVLFLEETHEQKKTRRDVGLEVGQWMLGHFSTRKESPYYEKSHEVHVEEARFLLEEDLPPGYCTREGSPRYPLSRATSPNASHKGCKRECESRVQNKPRGAQAAFTKQVILNIIGYGLLA